MATQDSYQQNNMGGKIRAALNARTDCKTIPQIFVGGEFVGGCTEVFDAYNEGNLQERLTRHGVVFDKTARIDPYSFFPSWTHPR